MNTLNTLDDESGKVDDSLELEVDTVSRGELNIGLLSFYDRLRERVARASERRGGRIGGSAADALLLVPDIFILMARLALDRSLPQSSRILFAGALAYFLLPTDLFPEAFVGVGGFIDDLVIGVTVLSHAFGDELHTYTDRHWSGSRDLARVVGDVSATAESLLGGKIYRRLQNLLASRGILIRD